MNKRGISGGGIVFILIIAGLVYFFVKNPDSFDATVSFLDGVAGSVPEESVNPSNDSSSEVSNSSVVSLGRPPCASDGMCSELDPDSTCNLGTGECEVNSSAY